METSPLYVEAVMYKTFEGICLQQFYRKAIMDSTLLNDKPDFWLTVQGCETSGGENCAMSKDTTDCLTKKTQILIWLKNHLI